MSPRSRPSAQLLTLLYTILGRSMLTARRVAAGLAIAGAGVLAYAVPVSAHSGTDQDRLHCVSGQSRHDYLEPVLDRATGDVTLTAVAPVCESVEILLSAYKVPDAWHPGD